tara:strand:- start:280 stop:507 length:228 start_codon:yes stop_codon:yes gene_type:complete
LGTGKQTNCQIKTQTIMGNSFLEYFKTLLPKLSFDTALMLKEYQKALKLLNPLEQVKLTNWLKQEGLTLQQISNH